MAKTKAQLRYEREREERNQRAKAEMVRLSNELHGGGIAPNSAEYQLYSEDASGREFVSKRWKGWANFAAYCGLEFREPKYYYDKAKQRRAEWNAIDKEPRLSAAQQRKEEQAQKLAPMGLIVKDTPRAEVWRSGGRTWQGLAWEVR